MSGSVGSRPPPHGGLGASGDAELRLAVVDERRLVREGLAALLRDGSGFHVVGGFAAVEDLDEHVDVDVVLVGPGAGTESPRVGKCVRFGDAPFADLVDALLSGREPSSTPGPPDVEVDRLGGHGLTAREAEVLAAMAAGDSNANIAESLGIASKTVETYKQRIFTKLGVRSAPEAVALIAGTK